jgi:hypothetical protein
VTDLFPKCVEETVAMTDDRQTDPFAPPELSTEVCCLHCGQTYDSWQIEWRVLMDADGVEQGFWCCPIWGCDGRGFGLDILPVDPNYCDERGGWFSDADTEDGAEWNDSNDLVSEWELDDDVPWEETDFFSDGPPDREDDFPFSENETA